MRPLHPHDRRGRLSATTIALAALATTGLAAAAGLDMIGAGSRTTPSATPSRRVVKTGNLRITVAPASRTATAGTATGYRVRIIRGRLLRNRPSLVRLRLTGRLPAGTIVRWRPAATRGGRATLVLRTAPNARPGVRRLRILAVGHSGPRFRGDPRRTYRTAASIVLRVIRPVAHRFSISGRVDRPLAPGVTVPIDLRLTNPHRFPLHVRWLAVRVVAVHAPGASPGRSCGIVDFAMLDAGPVAAPLPAHSTRTLSALRVPPEQRPRIAMRDAIYDQGGCKHASLELRFSGEATGGAR